jgi:hypothetical protein
MFSLHKSCPGKLITGHSVAISAQASIAPQAAAPHTMSTAPEPSHDSYMGQHRDIPLSALRNHRVLGTEEQPVINWQCKMTWWGHSSWNDYSATEVAELERGFVNEAPVVLMSTWPDHEFHLFGVAGGMEWTQFSRLTGKHRAIRRVIVTSG